MVGIGVGSVNIGVNEDAKLPQIRIIPKRWYDSFFMRILARAVRMGALAAFGQAMVDPTFVPSFVALVATGEWDKVQILALPLTVAFFSAVEKTWRDVSVGKNGG